MDEQRDELHVVGNSQCCLCLATDVLSGKTWILLSDVTLVHYCGELNPRFSVWHWNGLDNAQWCNNTRAILAWVRWSSTDEPVGSSTRVRMAVTVDVCLICFMVSKCLLPSSVFFGFNSPEVQKPEDSIFILQKLKVGNWREITHGYNLSRLSSQYHHFKFVCKFEMVCGDSRRRSCRSQGSSVLHLTPRTSLTPCWRIPLLRFEGKPSVCTALFTPFDVASQLLQTIYCFGSSVWGSARYRRIPGLPPSEAPLSAVGTAGGTKPWTAGSLPL